MIYDFMCHLSRFLFALAVTVSAAAPGSAAVWVNVGPRYQAMGGAGVAIADDSLAQYWNPAAFAFMRGWDAQLPISTNYSIENQG